MLVETNGFLDTMIISKSACCIMQLTKIIRKMSGILWLPMLSQFTHDHTSQEWSHALTTVYIIIDMTTQQHISHSSSPYHISILSHVGTCLAEVGSHQFQYELHKISAQLRVAYQKEWITLTAHISSTHGSEEINVHYSRSGHYHIICQ